MRKISQPTNQKVNLVTKVPGPKSTELRKREDDLIAPGLQGFALNAGLYKLFKDIIKCPMQF